jgi:hypothetical protein
LLPTRSVVADFSGPFVTVNPINESNAMNTTTITDEQPRSLATFIFSTADNPDKSTYIQLQPPANPHLST